MMVCKFNDIIGSGVGQIPPDAIIVSAKLSVVTVDSSGTPPSYLHLHTGLTKVYNDGDTVGVNDGDFSTAGWRQYNAGIAWDGGSTMDKPRHGIDYTADYQAQPVSRTEEYVTFDVTADMAAFLDGSLENNGWWLGTETGRASPYDLWRVGAALAGWGLGPRLVVEYALTCEDLPADMKNVADLNGDCRVNWADFSIFAANWLDCTNPQGCN